MIHEMDLDWEDKMAQLQRVEARKDGLRQKMREMEQELKQADEELKTNDSNQASCWKRALEFEDDLADAEPLQKRARRG